MTLSSWNKNNVFKFTVDNTEITEDLVDFPVLLNIGTTVGKTNTDNSDIVVELVDVTSVDDTQMEVLLRTDGANVQDMSSNNFDVVNTNVAILDSPVQFTGYSMYFNGASSLDITTNPIFAIGAADFTVDTWIRLTTANWGLLNIGGYSSGLILTGSLSSMYIAMGNSWPSVSFSSALALDTWYHLAVIRYGDNIKVFIDGVEQGLITSHAGKLITDSTFRVGSENAGLTASKLIGHLQEFRFIVGRAEWWDNFTPPSGLYDGMITSRLANNKKIAVVYPSVQEHTMIVAGQELLLQSNTTEGDTIVVDSTGNHTITNITVTHTTTEAKFGTSSMYFNGTTAWLELPPITLGVGDFTIDWWFNSAQSQDSMLFDSYLTTTGWWMQVAGVNSYAGFSLANNSGYATYGHANVYDGEWHHIAYVRKSSTLKIFIDGTMATPSVVIDASGDKDSGDKFFIGAYKAAGYRTEGYYDQFRITKEALWDTNFQPPTAPVVTGGYTTVTYIHGEQEQCYCEIMGWDTATNEAQLWARVPKVLSAQPTDLLLYYDKTQEDNTQYIGDTGDLAAQQVWSNDYVGVYHMSDSLMRDSTVKGNDGTLTNMDSTNVVAGQIGKVLQFNGADEYVTLPSDPELYGLTAITVEAVVMSAGLGTSYPTYIGTIYSTAGASEGFSVWLNNNTSMKTLDMMNRGGEGGTITTTNDSWYENEIFYAAMAHDGSNQTLYKNNLLVASSANTWALQLEGIPTIGRESTNNYYYKGTIGKVRISKSVRSDSWLRTSYFNTKDTLVTVVSGSIYRTGGYVKELGVPVQRQVFLYERTSGTLMDKCVSDVNGYYILATTVSGSHNVVCLDSAADPDYNDLIISKIEPTEVIQ